MKRFWKYIWRVLVLAVVLIVTYLIVVSYPEWFAKDQFEVENLQIYSDQQMDPAIGDIAAAVLSRIKRSELYDAKASYQVFICQQEWVSNLLTIGQPQAVGLNNSLNGKTIVRKADIANNEVRDQQENSIGEGRDLVYVISHEIGHAMLRNHLGFWPYRKLSIPVNEGYAEWIGRAREWPTNLDLLLAKYGQNEELPLQDVYVVWAYELEQAFAEGKTLEDILTE